MRILNRIMLSTAITKSWAVLFLVAGVTGMAGTVDWQGPAGSKIKEIRYFPKKTEEKSVFAAPMAETTSTVVSNVIDSPPIDGFVPWIVLTATNEREDETFWEAVTQSSYIGAPTSGIDPSTDYFIGLFDTGASTHVIGYENAVNAGLFNGTYLTTNVTSVQGVTGSVDAWVSMPYALFMDGLDALEKNGTGGSEYILPTTDGMKGQSNISTIIGDNPGTYPDLATAIGSPMSLYYTTHIEVDKMITVTHGGIDYTAPKISFYNQGVNEPNYPNFVPLELKPLGAINVQWAPALDSLSFEYIPGTPSIIVGNSSQSLFFVHGVDMSEGNRGAYDKDRFMLDTGAQVTVIGQRIAARLGLHPENKEFEVDIEGVTGEVTKAPGFYIDSLTIPAVGEWLEFTNVPVIILEISSPEGGKLDGIIGMNLFTKYNLIFRGGGIFLEEDPRMEFEKISTGPVAGDIGPEIRDGQVDLVDYSVFSQTWMATDIDGNWNADADFVPTGTSEGVINIEDLSMFAEYWLTGASL
ncbi:MAG: retropepsin-like aspartic protease family protein [Planctomycetota bacterium]|jgi:predicted aspartyl protease